MNAPVFVSAVYGSEYLTFLTAHLYSVQQTHPECKHVILWRDLPDDEIQLLESAFPQAEFSYVQDEIQGTRKQKVPRKLHLWKRACETYAEHPLIFLDCDLLVLRRLDEFIPRDVDIVFTWKDEPVPLNTGVIMLKPGPGSLAFLDEWIDRTEALVEDEKRLKQIRKFSGAGSQHTFREIAGWVNYDGAYTREVRGQAVTLRGVSCTLLNEVRCVPITDQTHVVHYKSGWQPILKGEGGFTDRRPRDKCAEMFELWNSTERKARRKVAECLASDLARETAPLESCVSRRLGDLTVLHVGVENSEDRSPAVQLPSAWLKALESALTPAAVSTLPREPASIRGELEATTADNCLFVLQSSLGSALSAILAWLATRGALPRAMLIEGPVEDGMATWLQEFFPRSAPLHGTSAEREGYLVLPQVKDARILRSQYPSLGSERTGDASSRSAWWPFGARRK